MRGGYRENSGRKKGFSAIEAESARKFIVEQVNASLEPIISKLIQLAKKGDLRAIQILFDRAYGRPITPIQANIQQGPTISMILDEIESDSTKFDDLYEQQKAQYEPAPQTKRIEHFEAGTGA